MPESHLPDPPACTLRSSRQPCRAMPLGCTCASLTRCPRGMAQGHPGLAQVFFLQEALPKVLKRVPVQLSCASPPHTRSPCPSSQWACVARLPVQPPVSSLGLTVSYSSLKLGCMYSELSLTKRAQTRQNEV